MMTLRLPASLAVLVALTSHAASAADNLVLRVHTKIEYAVNRPKFLGMGQERVDVSSLLRGSGFHLRDGDRDLVVTAAHMVVGAWPVESLTVDGKHLVIAPPTVTLATATLRIRLGDVSIWPTSLLVDVDRDVAVLTVDPSNTALLDVRRLELAQDPVALGQDVRAWGFPGTAAPQLSGFAAVSALSEGFYVLAGSLGAGYSGGPVVRGEVVTGLVSRDDGKQARVVSVDVIERLIERSRTDAVAYRDGMQVAEVANRK